MSKPNMLLWLSDSRGQYIPRDFAKSFADRAKDVSGVSDEDWAILEAGPDYTTNSFYWEAWEIVCDKAVITDDKAGVKYTIWQDGDCWLVPIGMEWSDEENTFVWPDEETDEESESA